MPRCLSAGSKTQETVTSESFLQGIYSPFSPGRTNRQPQDFKNSYTPKRRARGQFADMLPRPSFTHISERSRKRSPSSPANRKFSLPRPSSSKDIYSVRSLQIQAFQVSSFYKSPSKTANMPALIVPMIVASEPSSENTTGQFFAYLDIYFKYSFPSPVTEPMRITVSKSKKSDMEEAKVPMTRAAECIARTTKASFKRYAFKSSSIVTSSQERPDASSQSLSTVSVPRGNFPLNYRKDS